MREKYPVGQASGGHPGFVSGLAPGYARRVTADEQPRCPTCGERDSEDIGQDVRRCRNCTYVWIPIAPEGGGED